MAALGAALLHRASVFQTDSTPLRVSRVLSSAPGLAVSSEVPPTLVTQGCDGGSRTLTIVVPSERMQEKAPVSPSAPNMLWPCSAICSKMVFSACT